MKYLKIYEAFFSENIQQCIDIIETIPEYYTGIRYSNYRLGYSNDGRRSYPLAADSKKVITFSICNSKYYDKFYDVDVDEDEDDENHENDEVSHLHSSYDDGDNDEDVDLHLSVIQVAKDLKAKLLGFSNSVKITLIKNSEVFFKLAFTLTEEESLISEINRLLSNFCRNFNSNSDNFYNNDKDSGLYSKLYPEYKNIELNYIKDVAFGISYHPSSVSTEYKRSSISITNLTFKSKGQYSRSEFSKFKAENPKYFSNQNERALEYVMSEVKKIPGIKKYLSENKISMTISKNIKTTPDGPKEYTMKFLKINII